MGEGGQIFLAADTDIANTLTSKRRTRTTDATRSVGADLHNSSRTDENNARQSKSINNTGGARTAGFYSTLFKAKTRRRISTMATIDGTTRQAPIQTHTSSAGN